MIKTNEYIKEIFSLLGNLCFPTVESIISRDLIIFLYKSKQGIKNRDLSYLKLLLKQLDLNVLETKYDKLNINIVEFTYKVYEEWIKYLKDIVGWVSATNYLLDKAFIETTSEHFFSCMLNKDLIKRLRNLVELKSNVISQNTIKQYEVFNVKIENFINHVVEMTTIRKSDYLEACVIVFALKIKLMYDELAKDKLSVDLIQLKLHILQYLRKRIEGIV
jgi:hypothetical protein